MSDRGVPPRSDSRADLRPDADPRIEQALQLASRLMALVKSGRAYSVRHIALTQQLENYLTLLEPILRSEGHARFDAPEGDMCMNGERLPYRANMARALEQLAQEFGARTLTGIEFTPGLTLGEFQSFMDLFLEGERWKGDDLLVACRDAGIAHLHVLPLHPEAVERSAEIATDSLPESLGGARGAWGALLAGTQQLLAGDALDHGFELRHLKRVAQPLIDSVLTGDRVAAALAHVTPGESAPAHAAHTALTALSVGAQLGLGRHDLVDLAVAALLHDVGHGWAAPGGTPAGTDPARALPAAPHTYEGVRRIAWATTFNDCSLAAMRAALEHHGTVHGGAPPAELTQLVTMADAYVAFLSRGAVRAEWMSPSHALVLVLERLRIHAQPALAVALVRTLGFYPPGQLVELADGSVVRALVPVVDEPERPWVQLVADARGMLIARGRAELMPLPEGQRIARALPRDQWPVDDAARPAA